MLMRSWNHPVLLIVAGQALLGIGVAFHLGAPAWVLSLLAAGALICAVVAALAVGRDS